MKIDIINKHITGPLYMKALSKIEAEVKSTSKYEHKFVQPHIIISVMCKLK